MPRNRLAPLVLASLLLGPALVHAAPPPEPKVEQKVSEDDHVRIEELRVRGETQRIVVRQKGTAFRGEEYEILPPTGARDPSQSGQARGQRVWRFSF